MLHSRALAGKLEPLSQLLDGITMTPNDRGRSEFGRLSQHLGIPIRKASPEALAAIARWRAAGGADGQ